tara:strand:+ start:309 stop:1166 length:858 start_codon:yes stop_codon:yes gene_type:complete
MNYNILINPFINIIKDKFNYTINHYDAKEFINNSVNSLNLNNKILTKEDSKIILNHSINLYNNSQSLEHLVSNLELNRENNFNISDDIISHVNNIQSIDNLSFNNNNFSFKTLLIPITKSNITIKIKNNIQQLIPYKIITNNSFIHLPNIISLNINNNYTSHFYKFNNNNIWNTINDLIPFYNNNNNSINITLTHFNNELIQFYQNYIIIDKINKIDQNHYKINFKNLLYNYEDIKIILPNDNIYLFFHVNDDIYISENIINESINNDSKAYLLSQHIFILFKTL